MNMNNNFYILKGEQTTAASGQINITTGDEESSTAVGQYRTNSWLTSVKPENDKHKSIFVMFPPDVNVKQMRVFFYDKDAKYLGYSLLDTNPSEYTEIEFGSINEKVTHIKCDFILDLTEDELAQMTQAEISSMLTHVWVYAGYETEALHYSKLQSKYKKETNQIFFRNSLEGTLKAVGYDYKFINSQSLETKFLLIITSADGAILAINSFTKTDCKFDNARCQVELKLSAIDRYSKLMDKYDNTYDLIKLSPAITPLILTKRLLYQFYIQGANSVTCYANGTYWEQDVNEAIDDADELKKKYYFAENFTKQEISIDAEQSRVYAGTYIYDATKNEWTTPDGGLSIYLRPLTDSEKVMYNQSGQLSTLIVSLVSGLHPNNTAGESVNNIYKLQTRDNKGSGSLGKLESVNYVCTGYTSDEYGPFNGLIKGQTNSLFGMRLANTTEAAIFNLKDCLIDYTIWARVLADVDTAVEPSTGETKTLYDLPNDDFVSERINYRKCIGLIGLQVQQSTYTVKHPTKYGRNDYGEYFSSNFVTSLTRTSHRPVPISRSSWANSSIWAIIPDNWSTFENEFRTVFTLKDAYSLADVIKALLHKIDPLIKFEATKEYSQFLYEGETSTPIIPFDGSRVGYEPFIAPKSNVLKGNYDQAAQKAEITFEQVMNMLRDCFRCYWYIDEESRLRIEHISYFMKGLSYSEPNIQLDLTKKDDKFNKKPVIYAQESTSYNKDDLNSRYEFSWMDDSTDIFEDMEIDVNSVYTQSDKTEEVNSEVFSTDIDLMLYAPDKFSSDGFALMMANKNTGKVPLVSVSGLRDDEYLYTYSAMPQNYLCSWLYLARYYMLDMPAYKIVYTRAPSTDAYRVIGIKQFKQQDIEFQTADDLDLNKAIKTSIGTGIIDSLSVNIDTHLVSATLVF